MNQHPPADQTPTHAKRGAATGRVLIAIAIVAVIVIAIIVAVAVARGGETPEFAMAAPANTPFYAELGLDTGINAGEEIANSRLVRDEQRDAFRRYLQQRLQEVEDETDLGRQLRQTLGLYQDPESMPTRVAIVTTRARSLDEVEPDDMVMVAEFEDEQARNRAAQAMRIDVVQPYELDDRPLLVLGGSQQAVTSVIQRLEIGEAQGTLAGMDELEEVQEINRGLGLFLYFDVRHAYMSWLQETEATPTAQQQQPQQQQPQQQQQQRTEAQTARALGDVLPPERVGALGVWVGPEQVEMYLPIENNPLTQADVMAQGGEEILDYLPRDTLLVNKVSMFAGEARDMHRFLRRHAPFFVNLLELVRREGSPKTRGQQNVVDFEQLTQHFDQYAEVMDGHVGAAIFPLDVDVRAGLGSVVVVLVNDLEEARTRLWQAKAQLDIEGEWQDIQLDVGDETLQGVDFGGTNGVVVFRDNAAVYLMHATQDRPFLPSDITNYFNRLDQTGSITDHDGWDGGMDKGVSFDHTIVSAINVAGLAELFDLDIARREHARAAGQNQQPVQQQRPQQQQQAQQQDQQQQRLNNPLADVFLGMSVNVEDDGLRGYVSAGLVDLGALAVLTDFAVQQRGLAPEAQLQQQTGETPQAELDRQQIEQALHDYYVAARREGREPTVDEFLRTLSPEQRQQLERMQPSLQEQQNRLLLTATDPTTGQDMQMEAQLTERDLDLPPAGEEPPQQQQQGQGQRQQQPEPQQQGQQQQPEPQQQQPRQPQQPTDSGTGQQESETEIEPESQQVPPERPAPGTR